MGCAEGDPGALEISVSGGGTGAAFDPATGRFTWSTDGDDAGRVSLVVSARVAGSDALPETLRVSFDINDDPDAPNAQPPEPETYVMEHGLPVIHILHDEELRPADQPATFHLLGQHLEGEVKIRGATSRA